MRLRSVNIDLDTIFNETVQTNYLGGNLEKILGNEDARKVIKAHVMMSQMYRTLSGEVTVK